VLTFLISITTTKNAFLATKKKLENKSTGQDRRSFFQILHNYYYIFIQELLFILKIKLLKNYLISNFRLRLQPNHKPKDTTKLD
jgi:hypothetical protein